VAGFPIASRPQSAATWPTAHAVSRTTRPNREARDLLLPIRCDPAQVEDGAGASLGARRVRPLRLVAPEFDEHRGDAHVRRAVVGTFGPDLVPLRRVPIQRRDGLARGVRAGAGELPRLAAVLRVADVAGEVGSEERPRLARVPGDDDEEIGVVEGGVRAFEVDVQVVEGSKREAVGPVVRAAAIGVGPGVVVAFGPVADVE